MRTACLLRGSGLAVVAAGLFLAPAAYADDTGAQKSQKSQKSHENQEKQESGESHKGLESLEVSPQTVVPGSEVTVSTTACGAHGAAAGDASAVGAGTFALSPDAEHRSEDGRGGYTTGRFRVPPSARPETYQIVASCEGGRRVTGDLLVALASAHEHMVAGEEPAHPHGHVRTGVGGALGRDPVRTAAGVAALAVAAAGGTWLLHRRARGDGI